MPVKERGAGRLFRQGRLGSVAATEDSRDEFWQENIDLIREALEPEFAELRAGQAKILEVLTTQGTEITEIKVSISTIQANIATIQLDINEIKASLAEKKG